MGSVVILGAGPAGLAAGIMWGESGLDVTVVDKDPSPVPEDPRVAWEDWRRPGVSQFRQAHTLQPRGATTLREMWPGVFAAMQDFGAHPFNTLDPLPPMITDTVTRPGDERFKSLGARRPVYELSFARVADNTTNLRVIRGKTVTALRTGLEVVPGTPNVTGVDLSDGDSIEADLVVDAMGRRSPLPSLLEQIGSRPLVEEGQDSRFAYYSRFYRKRDRGEFPHPYIISLFPAGSISILTLPGDNNTWSVTIYTTTSDKAMRAVRDPQIFERVVRAVPARAAWVEGDPITDVDVMAGISDRERSLVVEGSPVATGVVSIADAWACTNPSLGRGISMALMHIAAVTPTLKASLDKPAELAERWHEITKAELGPWHQATLKLDGARNAEMDAIRAGDLDPSGNTSAVAGGQSREESALFAAMMTNGDVLRAALEIAGMYSLPDEIMARPEIRAKVGAVAADRPDIPPAKIPTRAELESLLD